MENIKQSVSNNDKKIEAKEDSILVDNNLKTGNTFKKNVKKPAFNQQNNRQNKLQKISVTGYEEKVVGVKRISKTTKGGRSMRFSALVVIGDKKGLVGFGMGKSIEVPVAIKKALKNAKNNMYKIKMNKNCTLFHEIIGKYGAGRVMLKPAKEGTGIIAGGPIRVVLELSGFKDVYSKNLGKNTSINMIRATLEGLLNQKTPKEISFLRDKNLKEL